MLTARQILARSLKVFAAAALLDALLTLGAYALYGWPTAHEVFGDAALFETAVLLLAGGFYDWTKAEWGVGFSRLTGKRDASYDPVAHSEADRKGMALVAAGAWVFLLELLVELILAISL
jgi:hypothetical protein